MPWLKAVLLLVLSFSFVSAYDEDVAEVTLDVINSAFGRQKLTSVTFIDAHVGAELRSVDDFVGELLAKIGSSHIIQIINLDTIVRTRFRRRLSSNVVIANKMRDFRNFASTLTHHTYDFGGFYVIVFKNATLEETHKIFQTLWDFYIYNLCLIREVGDQVVVETFFPFQPSKCNTTEPVIVAKHQNGEFVFKPAEYFPKKFQNFHQCPLKFSTYVSLGPSVIRRNFPNGSFELVGRDVDVRKALSESFNFKPERFFIEGYGGWGYYNANGTSTHGMGRAIRRQSDFILGGNNLKYDRSLAMSHSYGYFIDTLIVMLPPSQEVSSIYKLIRPLDNYVWICVLFSITMAMVVIVVIQFQSREIRNFVYGTNVRNPCMNLLTAIVGGCQEKLPRRNFSRSMLMMFLLFCIVIRSVYQGSLYNHLQKNDMEQDPQTLEEIAERNMTFYILISWDEMTVDNPIFKGRRVLVDPDPHRDMLNDTLKENFNGVLMTVISEVLYANKLRSLQGLPLFKVCKDHFTMIPVVMYFPKNSYLVEPFNMRLLWLESSGLIRWWQSNYAEMKYLASADFFSGPRSLRLSHLSSVFQIWASACITGFGIFIFELIFSDKRIEKIRLQFCRKRGKVNVKKTVAKPAIETKKAIV